jgi:hypothetical protein
VILRLHARDGDAVAVIRGDRELVTGSLQHADRRHVYRSLQERTLCAIARHRPGMAVAHRVGSYGKRRLPEP